MPGQPVAADTHCPHGIVCVVAEHGGQHEPRMPGALNQDLVSDLLATHGGRVRDVESC